MTTTETTPTKADALQAIKAFAQAASRLVDIWFDADEGLDVLLTDTYPQEALPMSFDEIAAELWAWSERVES